MKKFIFIFKNFLDYDEIWLYNHNPRKITKRLRYQASKILDPNTNKLLAFIEATFRKALLQDNNLESRSWSYTLRIVGLQITPK